MESRRRQQQGAVFENLLALPWYLNAGIAVAVYIPIKYLPIFIQLQSPTASASLAVVSDLAIFIALIPFAAAIISGVRSSTAGDDAPHERIVEPPSGKDEVVRNDVEQIRQSETEAAELLNEVCDDSESGKPQKPESLNLELFRQIEWKRFEALCKAYIEVQGGRPETTKVGPDGEVDIRLFKGASQTPIALVRCRARDSGQIGIEPVRELSEVTAAEGIPAGIFMTTGSYTQEARALAKGRKLILISGSDLLRSILEMTDEAQERLLDIATEGDYATPTCPGCDTKMELRKPGEGSGAESFVWGCIGEPRCETTFEHKPEMA